MYIYIEKEILYNLYILEIKTKQKGVLIYIIYIFKKVHLERINFNFKILKSYLFLITN